MATRKSGHTTRKRRATTADVVGTAGREFPVPAKWRKPYEHLLDLRNHLLQRQADLAKDAIEEQPTFSTHMADAGTDTYDRDFALGMLSSRQDSLYQIEQAIDRVRNGTYGVCEMTGKPIEPERLEAIPWARFSTDAEKRLEEEGRRKRARLGERESVAAASASLSEEQPREREHEEAV
jgi:RNA polymerase-binding transcription factor DksA